MHKLTALALSALLAQGSFAQEAPVDTALYRQDLRAAVASYHQALGIQVPLYNGIEYMRYPSVIEGLPYYVVDDWRPATITYNGIVYADVPTRYDLVKDQLVVQHPDGFRSFLLFSPRVAEFTLGGSHFIYLPADSAKGAPAAGFYQVLARGAMTVLAHRHRKLEERLADRQLHFEPADKFYILKEGTYYSPRKEGELLDLVGERKKEARQLLQGQKLRFRKFPEQAILSVAEFYNH